MAEVKLLQIIIGELELNIKHLVYYVRKWTLT